VRPRSVNALTLAADPVDLKLVVQHLEAQLFGRRVLNGFDLRIEELDRSPALHTNHVVVMLVIEEVFVAGNTVCEVDLSREATLGEDLHGAIHRRVTDTGIEFLDGPVNVFDTPVTFMTQKCFEDQFAMRRDLQVSLPQVVGENLHLRVDRLHGPDDVGSIFTTSL